MNTHLFELSDDEKKKILKKHQKATKEHYLKVEEQKKGLQEPKKTSK